MTEQVDVVICGSGPAGLCAAVWLTRYGVNYRMLERRTGPLQSGQADGVQCRTTEIFESFGIEQELLREAYHVLEVSFWAESEDGGIKLSRHAADTLPGISHLPHVTLSQAKFHKILVDEMTRASGRGDAGIEYGVEVQNVEVDGTALARLNSHPVKVTAIKNGATRIYRAKYVLGCDGAHSAVRKSMGFSMVGDSSDAVWGVIDLYPQTNFPAIRKKSIVQSSSGSLLLIPKDGDELVRFYIEFPGCTAADVTFEELKRRARAIFSPYTMEIAEAVWWSAYSVGQRVANNFSKANRVFLTGDACHTHSPKAGQGMNTSVQDGYNIGWKLGAVLRDRANPALLQTYVLERQRTAQDLIEFDRYFANLFSSSYRKEHGITAEEFSAQFVKSGRYTAGITIKYEASLITNHDGEKDHRLATNVEVGMRLPSAQVVRLSDARTIQLLSALKADSRWHIIIFAGEINSTGASARLQQGIIKDYTPRGMGADGIFKLSLVLSGSRQEVCVSQVPDVFMPVTGARQMRYLHGVFCDDASYDKGHGQAYKRYGVNAEDGAVVVVRPDQYVSKVCRIEDLDQVRTLFDGIMTRRGAWKL